MKPLFALFLLVCTLSTTVWAREFSLATWHMNHLAKNYNQGGNARSKDEFAYLKAVGKQLNADIVALQEVDGEVAARRVLPGYNMYFSSRRDRRRVGFAVRRSAFDVIVHHEDFKSISMNNALPRGVDLSVIVSNTEIRILNIDMIRGCEDKDIKRQTRECSRLRKQWRFLAEWIYQRIEEGVAFAVVGDFGKSFKIDDDQSAWQMLHGEEVPLGSLVRVTQAQQNTCWGGETNYFLNHILLNKKAADFVVPKSFGQVSYDGSSIERQKISEHCPMMVRLDLPASAVVYKNVAKETGEATIAASDVAAAATTVATAMPKPVNTAAAVVPRIEAPAKPATNTSVEHFSTIRRELDKLQSQSNQATIDNILQALEALEAQITN